MDVESAAVLFDALSSAPRLRVLRHLVQAGQAGMTAGSIADALDISPSALSFHLSNLTERDVVNVEKQSRSRVYRVNFETLGGVVRFLLEDCCQNDPAIVSCCAPSFKKC